MNYNPMMLMVAVPILAGMFCLPLGKRFVMLAKFIALAVVVGVFLLSLYSFNNRPDPYILGNVTIFNVDTLSAFIGLAVSAFSLLIMIYSFGFMNEAPGKYFGYFLITLGSSLGVAFACNMVVLIVFWGIIAALLFLLVNMQGTPGATVAAKKALIIIGGTDALMIFGLCIISVMAGTFSMDQVHIKLTGPLSYAAYFSLAIAAFAKAGAVPFHSWLPDVAENAPTPVTAYLPASLDKLLGIYLLAKVSLQLFVMNSITNFALLAIGSVTIIVAVMMALVQHDLKRLLGYHAVSQVGYMVLGIGTGNPIGIAGGLFHMLNHAIYKSCLFLTGGSVEKKAKTTDLDELGGLAKFMPLTFLSCLVASLSISGIPPFNGFVSKWMIYQGIIESAGSKNPMWIVWLSAAMFGGALTVASFMKLLHSVFMGRSSKTQVPLREVGPLMYIPSAILAAACIIFGIFAFKIPVPLFIVPSIGHELGYIGIWSPLGATALVFTGILLGVLAYIFLKPGNFRSVRAFVGGEDPESLERLSGTDFYNTIKDIKAVGRFYKREENGDLDAYSMTKKPVNVFSGLLQYIHNGVLPSYMVWCLLGMVGLFVALLFR